MHNIYPCPYVKHIWNPWPAITFCCRCPYENKFKNKYCSLSKNFEMWVWEPPIGWRVKYLKVSHSELLKVYWIVLTVVGRGTDIWSSKSGYFSWPNAIYYLQYWIEVSLHTFASIVYSTGNSCKLLYLINLSFFTDVLRLMHTRLVYMYFMEKILLSPTQKFKNMF